MGDFSVRVIAGPTKRRLTEIERNADRGIGAGTRAVARQVQRTAKAAAPVYQGDRRDVKRGQLRRSIRTSRARRTVDGWRVTVAPRYPGVLYAHQEEAKHGFMRAGHDVAAGAAARAEYEAAWRRVVR